MQLSELYLDRHLYKTATQTRQAVNQSLNTFGDNNYISGGGGAADINTGNVLIDSSNIKAPGNDKEVIFNNMARFAADTQFVFDKSTGELILRG